MYEVTQFVLTEDGIKSMSWTAEEVKWKHKGEVWLIGAGGGEVHLYTGKNNVVAVEIVEVTDVEPVRVYRNRDEEDPNKTKESNGNGGSKS